MVWSRIIFRGNSTREPADDEQGDQFYSAGHVSHSQHRKNSGEVWKNAGEWTGRVEISKKKIMAVGVACMAIY